MGVSQKWLEFPKTYREAEARTVARWIVAAENGSVIGITGAGRTTFLEYLCYRADVLQTYLSPYPQPILLIPVDLYDLPDEQLSTFYRILLRSFYEQNDRFKPSIQQTIHEQYRKVEASPDPFLSQSALREVLAHFLRQDTRVVLVINRFDSFCEVATAQMTTALRKLHDTFKGTLSYIVAMARETVYLSEMETFKPLQGLLDARTCWVGPLAEPDARHMIHQQTRFLDSPVPEPMIRHLLALSGGYPSLLQVLCHWWLTEGGRVPITNWADMLLTKLNCEYRLQAIWQGLTDQEQVVLAKLLSNQEKRREQRVEAIELAVLKHLATKGVCKNDKGEWQVVGDLISEYVKRMTGHSRFTTIETSTQSNADDHQPMSTIRTTIFQGTATENIHTATDNINVDSSDPPEHQSNSRMTLLRILKEHFNLTELQELCLELNVDYDNLSGISKADKARELLLYCERHGLGDKLVDAAYRQRPNAQWNA